MNGDETVAKGTRREDRQSDKTVVASADPADELRARHLAQVIRLFASHVVKNNSGRFDSQKLQIDPFRFDLTGIQRLHAVIQCTGKTEFDVARGHGH